MNKLLLAASVLPLWSGTAVAQDVTYDWTGAYVGVQAGHGWGSGGMALNNLYTDTHPNGMLGGVYAGYNHQFPNRLVFGVEADVAWHNAADMKSRQIIGRPHVFDANNMDRQDIVWTAALRARAGYAIDRWIPYFSIGRGWAKVDQLFRNAGLHYRFGTTTFAGWTVGGGVEYAFKDNITLRADYRYSDFGGKTVVHPPIRPTDWHLKTHDIRFGIAYKF